jgi:predicted enzyme related to lactoylglutathione lyase
MNTNYPKNVVNWFDIPTLDFDRAVKFYSTILGAEMKGMDLDGMKMAPFPMSGALGGHEGVGGALWAPMPQNKPSRDGTHVHLNVEGRLDEILARVIPAGGKIVMPKTHLGEPGWDAMIEDTEGNVVGLHSYK